MVGVNIGDTLTPTPWTPEKIEHALSEARCSGYFETDAVKFWHCDAARILPTARHDHIRKVSEERGDSCDAHGDKVEGQRELEQEEEEKWQHQR